MINTLIRAATGSPCAENIAAVNIVTIQIKCDFVFWQVLAELKEYATEVDVDFVRKAVRAIGRCAIKVEASPGGICLFWVSFHTLKTGAGETCLDQG